MSSAVYACADADASMPFPEVSHLHNCIAGNETDDQFWCAEDLEDDLAVKEVIRKRVLGNPDESPDL